MKTPPSPESFLPLKPNWFHVLLSLSGQEQHGYGIMQEVLERTGGKVRLWPATLYGTIKRLIRRRTDCGIRPSVPPRMKTMRGAVITA